VASLNQVQIIGNLGKDPEVRYAPSGDAIASFSVACTESWKDKNTGEKKEATEWINIVIYGKLAEVAGQWLKKGQQVFLQGKIRTRKWQDQSGNDRYSTEVVASEMKMLGGKSEGGNGGNGGNSNRQGQQQQRQQTQQTQQRQAPAQRQAHDDFDEDIPF